MARWQARRYQESVDGQRAQWARDYYRIRVNANLRNGMSESEARRVASSEAQRSGLNDRLNRAVARLETSRLQRTRTQVYNHETGEGANRQIALARVRDEFGDTPRVSIQMINNSSYPTTQGSRVNTQGGGSGQRAGSGSGG